MQDKYKAYAKINILSLFFIGVSFISVTLAWFAYSGLTSVGTEIGVKAWYIEFDKDIESNNIVISLDDVYPGMETKSEKVKISNLGDSDAEISYTILSAKLLGNNLEEKITDPLELEDALSHNYPFHINISLDKTYAPLHGGESEFSVSISWPLDSKQDDLDSQWGSDSYKYMEEQLKLPEEDRESQIKIVISLKAEQYVGDNDSSSDPLYNLGDTILIDTETGRKCATLTETDHCIKTSVIDVNNTLKDGNVTLLPDLYESYENATFDNYDTALEKVIDDWNVSTIPLQVEHLLNIVSRDIVNSVLVRDTYSDKVIGNLKYNNSIENFDNRIEYEINEAIEEKGYYRFVNEKFPYLVSSKCYWTKEYDTDNVFALTKIDDTYSKIYIESKEKTDGCEVVPVIIASKNLLEQ